MPTGAALGRHAEAMAAAWYEEQGWRIVDRNWRCRYGEIDLVVHDGDTLAFCEVKARSGELFGAPEEAVTPIKRSRVRRAARAWLAGGPSGGGEGAARRHHGVPRFSCIRFDVASLGPDGLRVIEAAF